MEAERETSQHAELPDAAGPEWIGGEWGKLLEPDSIEPGTMSGSKEGKETRRPRSAETRMFRVGSWSHDPCRSGEVPGRRSSRSEFAAAEENRQNSVGQQLAAASPSSLCDVQRLPMDEVEASDLHQSGGSWGEEEEDEEEEGQHVDVDSEAASAVRYLTWLEDRWQLRLSSSSSSVPPPAATTAASDPAPAVQLQRVLQELLRAEERFIQEYGLSALQEEVGLFAQ